MDQNNLSSGDAHLSSIVSCGTKSIQTDRFRGYLKYIFLFLGISSLLPILVVNTPPLVDYPGHIGRYYIALNINHDSLLQQYWGYDWKIIANLGVDLLMMPLGKMLGTERAAWLIALFILPSMIWGIYRVSIAVHGEVQLPAIIAVIFTMSFPYQMGFMNYWLSVAIGLHYFASWVHYDTAGKVSWRYRVMFAIGALLLWLCHAYGWAVTVIWVGGYEAAKILMHERWQSVRQWIAIIIGTLKNSWPALVPLIALFLWKSDNGGAETTGWGDWGAKLFDFIFILRDQHMGLDLITVGFVFFFLFMAFVAFKWRMNYGLGLSAVAFVGLFILLPYRLMGSALADTRLLPILFITIFIGLKPGTNVVREHMAAMRVFIVFGIVLIALRLTFSVQGAMQYQATYDSHLKALEHVDKGARILVFTANRCDLDWRWSRTQHLASLAIPRKNAFVNTQWDVPGAQLLTIKFNPNASYRVDPSQYLDITNCKTSISTDVAKALTKVKANQYDYVWLFRMGIDTIKMPAYQAVYHDHDTVLYRINNENLKP